MYNLQHLVYLLCISLIFKTELSNGQQISNIEVYPTTTTIADGNSHVLICNVTGDPSPEISWYFEGQNIPSNINPNFPNQYTIPAFSASEEGQYYCAAENSLGKIVSSSISLKLAYFNVNRSLIPTSSILAPNTSFVLQCPLIAVDSLPPPSAIWLLDSVPIRVSYPLVITLEYSLVFSLLRVSDTGIYSCRVANSFLNVSEDIAVAALSQSGQILNTHLQYIVAPTNRTVNKGDDVSFQCVIVGSSSDLPTVWKFGDVTLTGSGRIDMSQNTGILTIKNTVPADTGSYSCNDASNQLGPRPFILTVIAPPVITGNQASFLQPRNGSNLSLSCEGEGTAPLSYSWFYNGADINESRALFSGDPSLRKEIEFDSLVPSDDGVYQCFVENSAGEDTKAFLLNVQVDAPRLIASQGDILAFVDGSFVFGCLATESPLSVYSYTFQNSPLPSLGYMKLNETHYRVESAAKSQSGIYACNISNSVGSVSDTFRVQIVDPTTSYSQMSEILTSHSNKTITLACRGITDSNYPSLTLSYIWELNGSPVNVSHDGRFSITGNYGDIQIIAVQSNDIGNYSCIAVTSDTDLTSAPSLEARIRSIMLLVLDVPTPPTNVLLTLNGSEVVVEWSAPMDNGGTNVLEYDIEYRVDSQTDWRGGRKSTSRFFTFPVCPSSNYEFRVYAVNMVGRSEPSESNSITIPDQAPSIFPVDVSVLPTDSPSQLNLTWKIPASNSVCDMFNGELTEHLIEYRKRGEPPNSNYTGSSDLSFLLTGLVPFTEYRIRIAFVNKHLDGSFSQERSGMTIEDSPSSPPTNFEVESYGTGRLACYCTLPFEPSRNGIVLGYKVTCRHLKSDNISLSEQTDISNLIILDDVMPGSQYECSALAYNSAGDGPSTASERISASVRKVPGLPNYFNITTIDSHRATIKYAPLEEAVDELLLTLLYTYPLTPHINRGLSFFLSNEENEYTLHGLDAGINYTVKLAGRNLDGVGFNRTMIMDLPAGRPSTPNISLSESNEGNVFIMWTVIHDGGSNITQSILQQKFPSDESWFILRTFYPYNNSYYYEMENPMTTLEIRIVIQNKFGNATSAPEILNPPSSGPVSTVVVILVVLLTSVLGLVVLLIVCAISFFACRRENKKGSLEFIRDSKLCENEDTTIFRNLNEQATTKRRTSFPQPSESSSDCTDNNPPSYHSNFPSKDSKTSIGSKSSKSSGSSRHKVEISERKQDPITKGVLAQPGKVQSAKLPHKTVVFVEHQTQSSIDSESTEPSQASWTNTFNRHVRDSPIPILEEDSPPLPPKLHADQQPHPLSVATNSHNVVHSMTNSDVWDSMRQDSLTNFSNQYPAHLISHKKSRSDELSDNYSARYDDPMDLFQTSAVKSRGKPTLRGKPQPTRSKSPISYLAQKFTLSPTKAKDRSIPVPSETPDPQVRAPSPSIDENALADAVFSDSLRKSRASYPVYQHQHTDSSLSQPASSQPSFY